MRDKVYEQSGMDRVLLEKQNFLLKESTDEFQSRVKREIIELKKNGFVKDKTISDYKGLLEETLSFFDRMSDMCKSLNKDVTTKQLITELRGGLEEVGAHLREGLKVRSGGGKVADNEVVRGSATAVPTSKVPKAKAATFASGTKKPSLEGSASWRARNHDNASAINSGFRRPIIEKADSTVGELPDFTAGRSRGFTGGRGRSTTMDLITQGRNASDDEISKMLKDVYISMCGSSNNADVNAKDSSTRDISLESFMTLEEVSEGQRASGAELRAKRAWESACIGASVGCGCHIVGTLLLTQTKIESCLVYVYVYVYVCSRFAVPQVRDNVQRHRRRADDAPGGRALQHDRQEQQ